MNTTAIAQHLNIATEAIVKIEEWATVLWVRFKGGCRFVSKKIMGTKTKTDIEKLEKIGGNRWTKGEHDRIYFHGSLIASMLKLSNSKSRQINASKFWYDVNTKSFHYAGSTCWGVTDSPMAGLGHPTNPAYWVIAVTESAGI